MRSTYIADTDPDLAVSEYSEREPIFSGLVPRLIGLAAGAVVTIFGLIAVARVDWSNHGIHAPAVSVDRITFLPGVAIATLVIGLLALGLAASRRTDAALALGVALVCVAIAIHFASTNAAKWDLGGRLAWLSGLVGAALILSGILTRSSRVVRRTEPRTVAGPRGSRGIPT